MIDADIFVSFILCCLRLDYVTIVEKDKQQSDDTSSNNMVETEDDSSSVEDDDSYDSDDEYNSDEDFDEVFNQFLQAHEQDGLPNDPKKDIPTPAELWKIFLFDLSESKVLKLTDACVEKYGIIDSDLARDMVHAVVSNPGLTHVILENQILQMVNQVELFQALSARHAKTLTYLKLCPDQGTLNVNALMETLAHTKNLTELELHNLTLVSSASRQVLAEIFKASALRQIYILGIDVISSDDRRGCLDPLFRAWSMLEPLDELRLEGIGSPESPMVSTLALQELLLPKQKWWRLGLDNLGLGDEHCAVIADMFARNEKCKAGDLLSLKSNPKITHVGYKQMFNVFYNKGRMGLIKVDDAHWVAEFDLVRSMNNLHGRLDVVANGNITSKEEWIAWVSQLGSRGWEPDSKKLNYMWFSLREHPEMVDDQ
jgi:hypothetical protein